MVSFARLIALVNRREPLRRGAEILALGGLCEKPCVELAVPPEGAKTDAFLTHEEIGGIRIAEVADEQAVAARHSDGCGRCIDIRRFEKLAVEVDRLPPLSGELGGLCGQEKESCGIRRVICEPWFDGGESFGGASFRETGVEDFNDIGFLLRGGVAEGFDAVVQRRGVCHA